MKTVIRKNETPASIIIKGRKNSLRIESVARTEKKYLCYKEGGNCFRVKVRGCTDLPSEPTRYTRMQLYVVFPILGGWG